MVLDRNPDNFFAETEQVAFGVQNLVPGHRLLQRPAARRAHPLLLRHPAARGWAGPNFHEIPINAPIAQAHNNQRDGFHRQAIHRGPRRLRAQLPRRRLPVPGGRARASRSFPEPIADDKVRGQAGEVRRPLLAGHAVLEQPDAVREGAHRPRLPLRADQGAGARDPRAHGLDAAQRLRRAGAGRWPTASGIALPQAHAAGDRAAAARGRAVAGAVPHRAAGRRQHPRTQDRHPGGARGRRGVGGHGRRRRSTEAGAVVRLVGGPARRRSRPPTGTRSSPTRTLETMPSVLFDAVVVPDGERGGHGARARWARRSSSSRTSTATASRSCCWAPARRSSKAAGVPDRRSGRLGDRARRAGVRRRGRQAPQLGPRHRSAARVRSASRAGRSDRSARPRGSNVSSVCRRSRASRPPSA